MDKKINSNKYMKINGNKKHINKNRINKLKNNKKAMEVQTVFYIFMSVIMIAIIVFGLAQVISISEQLSDTERVEIQNELKNKFESCEDPLNKGNTEYIKLEKQKFNSICFLGTDYLNSVNNLDTKLNNYEEFKIIGNSGDNIVLIKTLNINGVITENTIISSMKIDADISKSFCYFNTENDDTFYFELKCE
jgi:RNase P subunit RPR2